MLQILGLCNAINSLFTLSARVTTKQHFPQGHFPCFPEVCRYLRYLVRKNMSIYTKFKLYRKLHRFNDKVNEHLTILPLYLMAFFLS